MNVELKDWVAVAIGLIGLASAYLQSRSAKLPKWVQRLLPKLGMENLVKAIAWAEANLSTPLERRRAAAELIQTLAQKRLGLTLPDSIVNLLVEYVYQLWKRGKTKPPGLLPLARERLFDKD